MILSDKNIIHISPGKELNYIPHDVVRKTLPINQCLYLDLNCSQHPNMASSSLFLICFFRNTSLLSFHVANADGYHSRVNTRGSWDSPQQLIAQTCLGGRERAGFLSHIASLSHCCRRFLKLMSTTTTLSIYTAKNLIHNWLLNCVAAPLKQLV